MSLFVPGAELVVREVLHGRVWLEFREQILSDDGEVLASLLRDGTPFTFPEHSFPHPWAGRSAWSGATVLKLRREGDLYSVWKFFSPDGAFLHGYVNFEEPLRRRSDWIEVNDLQLDIVISARDEWRWKDVQDLAPAVASGRMSAAELMHVLDAASTVARRLEQDDRWWAPWDAWTPADVPVT